MFFYALKSAGPRGWCWNRSLNGEVFNDPEQVLVYQKIMFDRYYCIKSFCHLKNALESSFLYYYNGARKPEGFVDFEKACSIAKTYVILMSLN